MSFGGKSSTTKENSTTAQNQTQTQTLDPTLSAALFGNLGSAQGLASSYKPFSGELTAGFTPSQNAYFGAATDFANSGVGDAALNSAQSAAQGVSTYTPQGITADDIAKFLNPFTSQVVDATNADIEHGRQVQRTANAGSATMAGAFGGSGAALENSATNDAALRTLATTDGNLRSQGFTTALGAAQSEAARQDQAAQLRAQVASILAGISGQQVSQGAAKLGLLKSVGDQQQQQAQAVDTANYAASQTDLANRVQLQQVIAQALGLIPSTGTTTMSGTKTSNGTSNTNSTEFSFAPSFNPATGTISFGK